MIKVSVEKNGDLLIECICPDSVGSAANSVTVASGGTKMAPRPPSEIGEALENHRSRQIARSDRQVRLQVVNGCSIILVVENGMGYWFVVWPDGKWESCQDEQEAFNKANGLDNANELGADTPT